MKDYKLPEGWQAKVLELMAIGSHVSVVIKELGITRYYHLKLLKENEEYQETMSKGKLLSEAWWTEQGRANVTNKQFNHVLFIFMMKCVFRWRETEPEKKDDGKMADEDEKAKLREKYKIVEDQECESLN